ncbi:MAG TPA: nicotinate-nucleotide adenylyltransferase [Candidatus Thioglobus sp.]|nr:nicotinate-nucleotide adenylyltransferase [Candidatus Thioglobus sp.]HIL21614.1 nicotinate-nucleotide adenylyltransferase [Candidatus Thioglobus sp.]
MIGIYGGSFDPVHLGHLGTAIAIKNELNLEKCLMMPCATPAHKAGLHYSDSERLDILNLAIQDYSELEIDKREIARGGDSFTIDTLKECRQESPDKTLCLIIGMDSFMQFKSWKCWQEFTNFVHLIVLARPNYKADNHSLTSFHTTSDKKHLTKQQHGLLYFAECPLIDVSSSEIRGKIAANKNLDDFLPKTIINYIKNNDT